MRSKPTLRSLNQPDSAVLHKRDRGQQTSTGTTRTCAFPNACYEVSALLRLAANLDRQPCTQHQEGQQ